MTRSSSIDRVGTIEQTAANDGRVFQARNLALTRGVENRLGVLCLMEMERNLQEIQFG